LFGTPPRFDDPRRAVGERLGLVAAGRAGENEHGVHAGLEAETTSVSMRSPTIAVVSEWASMAFSADRIMSGFGLPTKYGSAPVARLISAATEPVAGSGPSGVGPVGSGLVAMKRAPEAISRIACEIRSKLYVRVSPSTT
jgi:hypothetical protein